MINCILNLFLPVETTIMLCLLSVVEVKSVDFSHSKWESLHPFLE